MAVETRSSSWSGRALALALGVSAAAAAGTPNSLWAQGQQKAPGAQKPAAAPSAGNPAADAAAKIEIGETTILSPELEFDPDKRQYIFTPRVELIQKDSHMTAKRMVCQVTPGKELEWVRCEGDVVCRKKSEDGTVMDATSDTLHYQALEQKADLEGRVVVHQSSAKLARPAVITGGRVDMDFNSKQNIIHRSKSEQARVHLEPVQKEGQPEPPEPIDLIADRIDMNSATQDYAATGSPFVKRPTSRMSAKRIRFKLDEKTNELNEAFGDDDVVYDSKNDKGVTIHATADKGVFNKALNQLTLTGSAYAETKDPDAEKPTVYQTDLFVYNTKTGVAKGKGGPNGQVKIILPQSPAEKKKEPGADTKAAADPKKPAEPKKTGEGKKSGGK